MHTPRLKVLQADEGRRFDVFGSAMLYKATAEDTGGAFSLALETTIPHGGLPLYIHHRKDEAMYILEGEYEIQCGEQVFTAGAGTFIFLPQDIPNRYQNLRDTPGKFLHLTCPGGFEEVVQQTSLLMSGGDPNMEEIHSVGRKQGVEFV